MFLSDDRKWIIQENFSFIQPSWSRIEREEKWFLLPKYRLFMKNYHRKMLIMFMYIYHLSYEKYEYSNTCISSRNTNTVLTLTRLHVSTIFTIHSSSSTFVFSSSSVYKISTSRITKRRLRTPAYTRIRV